jgi:hypothetical protein
MDNNSQNIENLINSFSKEKLEDLLNKEENFDDFIKGLPAVSNASVLLKDMYTATYELASKFLYLIKKKIWSFQVNLLKNNQT